MLEKLLNFFFAIGLKFYRYESDALRGLDRLRADLEKKHRRSTAGIKYKQKVYEAAASIDALSGILGEMGFTLEQTRVIINRLSVAADDETILTGKRLVQQYNEYKDLEPFKSTGILSLAGADNLVATHMNEKKLAIQVIVARLLPIDLKVEDLEGAIGDALDQVRGSKVKESVLDAAGFLMEEEEEGEPVVVVDKRTRHKAGMAQLAI